MDNRKMMLGNMTESVQMKHHIIDMVSEYRAHVM